MQLSSHAPRRARLLVGLLAGLLTVACGGSDEARPFRFDERRVQLFSRLDAFEVESGFLGGSARYLRLVQDPDRTSEGDRLRLRVSPESVIVSPPVELAGAQRLELGVGLGWIDERAPDEGAEGSLPGEPTRHVTRFVVGFRTEDGEERELARLRVAFDSHAGPTRTTRELVARLDPARAERGRFVFRTIHEEGPDTLDVLPSWWSPVLVGPPSVGPREPRPIDVVAVDLLARGADATVDGKPLADAPDATLGRLVTKSGSEPLTRPLVSVEPHFQTGRSLDVPRGGSRPALAFAGSARVELASVLDEGRRGRALVLAIGVDESLHAELLRSTDGPGFRVRVAARAGETELGSVDVPAAELAGGWTDERRLRIPDGATGDLELRVEVPDLEPERAGVWSADGESRPAVFARPWVALGRPRIVASRSPRPQPAVDRRAPNVLVLCAETLRADALDPWGGADAPRLAEWARRGLVFERAYSPSSWTLPSTASLLTGLAPGEHGAVSGESDQLGDWIPTLAEEAAAEGIRTGAFVTNELLRASKGFAAGFDTFVRAGHAHAGQVNRTFLDWLSERPDQRFFAYLHYFEPHTPYNAPGELRDAFVPEELAGRAYAEEVERVRRLKLGAQPLAESDATLRYLRARYRGEVRSLDAHVGALLDELEARGVLENTLVAFTADHAEEFGEHGWYGHGNFLYDEGVHVPLLLVGAGVTPGRVPGPVELLSLPLRVLETLGLERRAAELRGARPALPLEPVGRVAAPVWLATENGIDLEGLEVPLTEELERLDPHPTRAAIVGGKKVILRFRELPAAATREAVAEAVESVELYDLEADPGERAPRSRDLAEVPPELMEHVLSSLAVELAAARHMAGDRVAADTLDVLENLGYVEKGDAPLEDGSEDD